MQRICGWHWRPPSCFLAVTSDWSAASVRSRRSGSAWGGALLLPAPWAHLALLVGANIHFFNTEAWPHELIIRLRVALPFSLGMNKGWETIEATTVNSANWKEDDPTLSPDGLVLIFYTSDRSGTRRIYQAVCTH